MKVRREVCIVLELTEVEAIMIRNALETEEYKCMSANPELSRMMVNLIDNAVEA